MSLPSWNLSDLFQSIHDPRLLKHQKTVSTRAQAFHKKYYGKIKRGPTAALLRVAIQEYESTLQHASKPYEYAALLFYADSKTPEHGALLQKIKLWYQSIYEQLVFFELELGQINPAVFKKLKQHPALKNYHYFLHKQAELKKHHLQENEEKLLSEKSITGRSAFIRLFDQEQSGATYAWKQEKRSLDQMLNLLHDQDGHVRQQAAEMVSQGFRAELPRMTFILNTLVQDKISDDRYRKFETPEAARHLDNQTDQKTVDTLSHTVTRHYKMVQDFYELKKKILGVKKLNDYDRYAPLPASKIQFSFPESKKIILEAFHRFSPDYAKLAQKFFDQSWIDAAARPGKRGGAFCMYLTPDLHPYVLVNFVNGDLKDVLTLAHELGHGVHASLAREQNYLNFDHPLTVAETASIFGEMLVFNALKERLTDPREKLALYLHKIEGIFASVFRQIAMYRFEQDVHQAVREKGELKSEEISAFWRKRQTEMFGSSITLTKNYDIWWSYISHFIHSPFYVYAYAFGELLTLSLYAQYKQQGEKMVKEYLMLLRSGGSKSPQDLVKPFGIDLTKKDFWESGIKLLEDLVEEAKELCAHLPLSKKKR